MHNDSLDQKPYFKRHIFCCGNERPAGHPRGCCKEKGGVDLRNYLKSRVSELKIDGARVNMAGCLDRCELGAVMVIYPEGVWYTYASREDIDEITDKHLMHGEIVERLLLTNDQKELRAEQKTGRTCDDGAACG
ncbi:MAG: (2Fe-2S) ferredoxin domain-containing protein [Alphaproteobacteria bacterium]|nr:(2Fe-2S) ferredoxin domain-containing protein [Alphaproteobacteria bacterium]